MIDTKELRILNIYLPDDDRKIFMEAIDRLEAAESEALEQARLNGMGSERERALMAKLEAAEKERDAAELMSLALRAKITEMEKQEPVAWMQSTHLSSFKNRFCGSQSSYVHCSDHQLHPDFKPLYALPGAQPAHSVPDGWKLVPIEPTGDMVTAAILSSHAINTHRAEHCYRAMIAAAPEAKP